MRALIPIEATAVVEGRYAGPQQGFALNGSRRAPSLRSVIVTRRLAARYGLSGNSGSASALPGHGREAVVRHAAHGEISRTAMARPTDNSQGGAGRGAARCRARKVARDRIRFGMRRSVGATASSMRRVRS